MTPRFRRFSVDEFHRLLDENVLRRGSKTELLEGLVVEPRERTERRVTALSLLRGRCDQATPAEYALRVDEPLTLSDDTELWVDFAFVTHERVRRSVRHPATASLVIELIDGDFDDVRASRLPHFAAGQVGEVWFIDLRDGRVEASWKFTDGQYHDALVLDRPATLTARTVPSVSLSLAGIF